MQGKRKYIAIVLFLLIGLTIFTFASNDNELENTKNNLNSNIQQDNSKNNESNINDSENNSNGGTVNNKVNTNNTIKNNTNNSNIVNNNNINSITDNSYDIALEAVKKLENTYSSTDYDSALALVANVSDETKKSELETRVSEAKKVIDANSLVSELEKIYSSDLSIKNLTNSRSYKTSNDIDNVVDSISDTTIKSNLKARLSVISRVLNDTVAPKVTGVTNNSVVNNDVTLVVSDDTTVTKSVLLNGKETNSFANTEVYDVEGKYEITYVDEAFNKTVIEFIIDKTNPVISGVDSTKPTNKNEIVYVSDVNLETVTIDGVSYTKNDFTVSNGVIKFQKKVTSTGTHKVVAVDGAGNTSEVSFVIDKVSPIIESIVKSNNDLPTNQNVTVTVKLNENCVTPDGWTKVSDTEFTKVYKENGKDNVTFSDLAGNTVVAKIEVKGIDKEAPVILSLDKSNNDLPTNQDVTVTIKLNENCVTPDGWTKVSDTEFTKVYSSNGDYYVTVKDLVGNTLTHHFNVKGIDKEAPVMTSLRMTGTKYYNENGNIVWYVKNNETIYVYVTFAEKLYTNPTITLNDTKTVTAYLAKEDNNSYIYAGAFKLTDNDGLKDGYVSFKVEGYADEAGNVGVTLTNEDITLDSQKYVIIDRTPVSINLSDGTIGNNYYSKINVKLYDAFGGIKVKVNDTELPHTGYYVDINDGHAYTFVEGENIIIAEDKAGNITIATYIKDTVAPEITVKSVVGKEPHYSQISFKLYDNNAIDYFVLNGTKYDRTDAMWSDANYQNIKDSLIDGENTLVLHDAAGNSSEYKFVLDLVAPTISVKDTSEKTNDIYTKISFKLSDDHLIDYFMVNGTKFDVTDNMYGDANYGAIKGSLKEGENTITLYDTAGNSSELEFEYTTATLVTNFTDLKNALTKSGTIKVLNDIVIEEILSVSDVNVVLDMNGKKFTLKDSSVDPMFSIQYGASIVFTGEGTIDLENNYFASFMEPFGDVTIENGNYLRNVGGTNYGAFFVGIRNGKGKLIINGGYFDGGYYKEKNEFDNSRTLVNISWRQYARINGGTFVGQNPAYGDEGMAYTNPNRIGSKSETNYCQGLFFEGQQREDTEIPSAYTISTGTLSDGRPTYTVHYNK